MLLSIHVKNNHDHTELVLKTSALDILKNTKGRLGPFISRTPLSGENWNLFFYTDLQRLKNDFEDSYLHIYISIPLISMCFQEVWRKHAFTTFTEILRRAVKKTRLYFF